MACRHWRVCVQPSDGTFCSSPFLFNLSRYHIVSAFINELDIFLGTVYFIFALESYV